MSNLILGFPNRADFATYQFGNWMPSLPISNVGTRDQWEPARSWNLMNTSWQMDLGRVTNLRVFALANHNLSLTATWRILIGSQAGGSDIYDSGNQAVWTMSFDTDMLEWESASFWEGAVDDPTDYQGYPFLAIHALPSWVNARYVTIFINDTSNPAGYVQIGRLFAGGGFNPKHSAAYGLKDSWVDGSEILITDGGHPLGSLKRRRRTVSFALEVLSQQEADIVHEMQRRQGLWGEVLYVPNVLDQARCQRYGMLGRMAELSAIDYPRYNNRATGFSIKEL